MAPDQECYDFIKSHEGCKNTAYTDSAGIWTIGYGTIRYENGTAVKKGDVITQQRAEALLAYEVNHKAVGLDTALGERGLAQHKYNALVSFVYNVGLGALQGSTLLKRVKANPDDPAIRDAFMMWDKVHKDGQLIEVPGLKKRRTDEANLYFS